MALERLNAVLQQLKPGLGGRSVVDKLSVIES